MRQRPRRRPPWRLYAAPGHPSYLSGHGSCPQELEILQPVVFPVAIDVMELHRQGLPPPLGDPAPLASVLLETGIDEPCLHVRATSLAARHEDLLDWRDPFARNDGAAPHSLAPGCRGKTETLAALAHRETFIDCRLHLAPVVPAGATVIGWHPQAPGVVRDRCLGYAELSTDRVVAEPLRTQTTNDVAPLRGSRSGALRARSDIPPANRSMPIPVRKAEGALTLLATVSRKVVISDPLPIDVGHERTNVRTLIGRLLSARSVLGWDKDR
jgi:hypothetical protein